MSNRKLPKSREPLSPDLLCTKNSVSIEMSKSAPLVVASTAPFFVSENLSRFPYSSAQFLGGRTSCVVKAMRGAPLLGEFSHTHPPPQKAPRVCSHTAFCALVSVFCNSEFLS